MSALIQRQLVAIPHSWTVKRGLTIKFALSEITYWQTRSRDFRFSQRFIFLWQTTRLIVFIDNDANEYGFYREEFRLAGEELVRFEQEDLSSFARLSSSVNVPTIEAYIINSNNNAETLVEQIAAQHTAPIIVLMDGNELQTIRMLFNKGADDIIRKPVHPEELVLRIASIKRRLVKAHTPACSNRLIVHFDGREPELNGTRIPLRRKERRILEYLAYINGRRATKSQIFEAVYGIDQDNFEDTVIESHICRLRKKLRNAMGRDPINSMRHCGYQLAPDYLT